MLEIHRKKIKIACYLVLFIVALSAISYIPTILASTTSKYIFSSCKELTGERTGFGIGLENTDDKYVVYCITQNIEVDNVEQAPRLWNDGFYNRFIGFIHVESQIIEEDYKWVIPSRF